MIDEIKKVVVFIGSDRVVSKNKVEDVFCGTGFLLNIDGLFFVGTAKHVIYDKSTGENKKNLWSAVRLKNGRYKKVYLDDIRNKYAVDWLVHKTKKYDVALLPIELDQQNDDFKLMPKDIFFGNKVGGKPDELSQLVFMSYQPGIEKIKSVNPIMRTAFVSRKNIDKTILIDANTFPGNSGSPVFMAPTLGYVDNENCVQLGNPTSGKFVGVISGYIPYKEVAISAQTNQARIIFEENTGIAVVHTYEVIRDIIADKKTKDIIKRLKKG